MAKRGIKKSCSRGHIFYKSNDCPVCPICEEKKKPMAEFLTVLSAPARRAMENAGITTLQKLAAFSEKEILGLHGLGPSSLPKLRKSLAEVCLTFKNTT